VRRAGLTEPGQLNQRALDRFTSALLEHGGKRGQLSKHTVHHYVRVVRQFVRWAAKEGEPVSGSPQLPRLPRKVLDTLTRDEITRMEDAAPSERDKLIIRLLADTGMRVGELCALRTGDLVRAQDRRAFLKVQGKGSKERLVPLSPSLVRRVDRYMRERHAERRTATACHASEPSTDQKVGGSNPSGRTINLQATGHFGVSADLLGS
jgi:integrase